MRRPAFPLALVLAMVVLAGSIAPASATESSPARITLGCGPISFCPDRVLRSEQMASLLARALDLPFVSGDSFRDDDNSAHRRDIERIAAAGITRGCSSDRHCPRDPVTRE